VSNAPRATAQVLTATASMSWNPRDTIAIIIAVLVFTLMGGVLAAHEIVVTHEAHVTARAALTHRIELISSEINRVETGMSQVSQDDDSTAFAALTGTCQKLARERAALEKELKSLE
jgi:hypothetical protein